MKDLFSFERCCRFIEAIANGSVALDTEFVAGPDMVLAAVDEVGITGHDFEQLDTSPGQFDRRYRDHGWHSALRRVRNDPANDLFERLAANNQKVSS